MRNRIVLLVAAVAAVAALVAVGRFLLTPDRQFAGAIDLGPLPHRVDRDRLNLVLVTLDTTRADRIGAYGGPNAADTPAFDRLAREGTLFERAMASAPLTLPSHATMFTGRFPPAHGLRDNGGFFLGPDAVTLAEQVRDAGLRTGAFVGAFVLDSKWGLDQGFEHYADDFDLSMARGGSLGSVQRPANEVVDLALPWLESVKHERFFAWLHFYDPHAPYAAAGTLCLALRRTALRGRGGVHGCPAGTGRGLPGSECGCSTGRSSPSSPTTVRDWASTARARTASSSTSPHSAPPS